MTKVKDIQVETIVEHLCTNMSSDKEQLRDISSIGLKTVIGQLPLTASDMAASVSTVVSSPTLKFNIQNLNRFVKESLEDSIRLLPNKKMSLSSWKLLISSLTC